MLTILNHASGGAGVGGDGGEGGDVGGSVGGNRQFFFLIKLIVLLKETFASSSLLSYEVEIKGLFSKSSLLPLP